MAISRLKQVVVSLAVEGILESVRGYVNELLKPVTTEHAYKAIQDDADPWDYAPKLVRRRGMRWARQLRKYRDRLTPELVLAWLREDRSDLASLIENVGPKGRKWLAKRTESIKTRLWPEPTLKLKVKGEKRPEAEEAEAEEPETEQDEKIEVRWG